MDSLRKAFPLHHLVVLGLFICSPAVAQQPATTLRAAFADANRDGQPDLKNKIVRLQLLITSGPQRISATSQLIYAQDSTRGIIIFQRDTTLLEQFRAGDFVDVTAKVDQYNGMEQLRPVSLRIISRNHEIVPRKITAAEAMAEDVSGLLVTLAGELVSTGANDAPQVALRDESGSIPVRLHRQNYPAPEFMDRLVGGGRAEIIGHAAQRDEHAPYDDGYHVVPLDEGGWKFAPVTPYKTIAWSSGSLLLAALALYMYLQRRRAEAQAEQMRALAESLERSREELRQAQKMESIGRLAGGVAHDFNNMLTAITGHAEFVLDQIGSDHAARADVEEIGRAASRAAALTHQLLAFGRKQVLQPTVIDVNHAITDLARMLHRLLGDDVALVTRLDDSIKNVYADAVQLQQVLMNLAVNARDAMPQGGTLCISTMPFYAGPNTLIENVAINAGSYSVIVVSDTGTGMDEQVKAAAFEPFFTTKAVGKGSGLGLSTVYGIVKQSGGYIFVDSQLGRGTTFTVYLPATTRDVQQVQPSTEEPVGAPAGNKTVLLVEDEAGVRELLTRVLKRDGYRVMSAAHGAEALQMLAATGEEIDLLLTDVVMPGMNGRELFQRIAARQPEVRVLFISGYTGDDIMHHNVLHHSWPFLSKPFTPSAVRQKVAEVLDREPSSPDFLLESWQSKALASS